MSKVCNWKNKEWMEFFNENRDLWTPVAREWERLEKEYLAIKQKQHESIKRTNEGCQH